MRAVVTAAAAGLVALVALTGLVGQAVRGDRTVDAQLAAPAVHDASVDDAYFRCIDVQAHSLVAPGRAVTLRTGNLVDVVDMLKAFGSWVTVADPPSSARVFLTLRDHVTGPGTCLGTQVVATVVGPGGHTVVRVGTGAQVPGQGPPPAPQL